MYTPYLKMSSSRFCCLALKAARRKTMVLDALDWVGLGDKIKSRPPQLSGGECQRVAIARAMVKQPEIVLADEPTANLDAANSHNILQTMVNLNREFRTTFIFATHDEKVINYVRRKIYLVDGKVFNDEIVVRKPGGKAMKSSGWDSEIFWVPGCAPGSM